MTASLRSPMRQRFSPVVLIIIFNALTVPLIRAQAPAPTSRETSIWVTVTDNNGGFPQLQRELFSIYEKKVPLEITAFEPAKGPASIIFLFDLSGSTTSEVKNASAKAAFRFVLDGDPNNTYKIIAFHEVVTFNSEWHRSADTELEKALIGILETKPNRKNDRNTALYDACEVALQNLDSSKYATRAVIMFTDGQDNLSKLKFKQLREQLRESSITLFAIGMIGSEIGSSLGMEGQGVLDELTSVTDGTAYYPKGSKDLAQVLAAIRLELSHRYIVTFKRPAAVADNKWHPIKVKLTVPLKFNGRNFNLNLRSRNGYFDR